MSTGSARIPTGPEGAPATIRPARLDEVAALNALIAESARALSRGHYTPSETEALITHVFGVDTLLLADRTYFVVEVGERLAACGGWSHRRTLFGGDQAKAAADPSLDPSRDAARIRAFFVHPDFARRGLGRALLAHCEDEARRHGFRGAELMATLPGVPLYRALGYAGGAPIEHPMPDGSRIRFVPMSRTLEGDRLTAP